MLNFLFTKTPLAFLTQSLWRDEAFSYLLAKKSVFDVVIYSAKDFNPPLYYLLLHFWMKLFGTSEIALRSLSLVMFWATIYLVYLFLTTIFKIPAKKSYFLLLFFILNPLLVYYAFETRMYGVFVFFAVLSFYSFYQKNHRLYLIATVLGLYAHYFMIYVIACQLLYLIVAKKKKYQARLSVRTVLVSLLLFIPWLVFIYGKIHVSQSTWISPVSAVELLHLPALLFTGYEKDFHYLPSDKNGFVVSLFYLSLILMIIIIAGFIQIKKGNRKQQHSLFYYLLIWSFFPPAITLLISFFRPFYVPRYLIFSTVGLLLLLVFAYNNLPRILRFIAIVFFAFYVAQFLTLKIKYQSKANLKKTIGEIRKLAAKDDVLYVTSELDFFVAQYYFDENRVYIYGKTYQEIPDYVGKVLIPKEKIVTFLPRYPKKAFILKSDQSYDIQAAY